MKRSTPTIAFAIVWLGVLIAAYVIGLGIKNIRFSGAEAQAKVFAKSEKPAVEPTGDAEEPSRDKVAAKPNTTPETLVVWEDSPSPEEEPGLSGERMQGIKVQFTNSSEEANVYEEERPEATPERSGGGWPPLPQLSEEDMANFREEMQELRDRAGEMTEEERRNTQAEIAERYGFAAR